MLKSKQNGSSSERENLMETEIVLHLGFKYIAQRICYFLQQCGF
jgi:hypothetical protein